jgi:hypothetical protein
MAHVRHDVLELSPLIGGPFFDLGNASARLKLLDLRFLVRHVLAHDRIVFLDFHLVGMQALVLRDHVEVARIGGRQEFDFFAHGRELPLNLHALGTQIGEHDIDAVFLDRAQTTRGDTQADPALLGFDPKALRVQIGEEATTLLVVGVGDAVTDRNTLASDFADTAHKNLPKIKYLWSALAGRRPFGTAYGGAEPQKGAHLYQPGA